ARPRSSIGLSGPRSAQAEEAGRGLAALDAERPLGAPQRIRRQPQVELALDDALARRVAALAVRLVAERAADAERRGVPVVGGRLGHLGAERVERPQQRREPHLRAVAAALRVAPQPRAGLDRAL